MTCYVKIDGGVVVQKQPHDADGFLVAPDEVVCGYLFDGQSFTAPSVGETPSPTYRVYKSVFVERMEPLEATGLEAHLQSLPPEDAKLRLMYAACDYFVSDDPLFAVLHWTVSGLLGAQRADELLAPMEA